MAFVPRLTAPSTTDLNWIHISKGGKNRCILRYGNSVLPNCVGYAWGRFMEILGKTPSLSCGNAGTWYSYTQDGYKRGKTPQLGAIVCWAKPGYAGHVAVVEKINSDGSIVTSNSNYSGKRWYLNTGKSPNWGLGSSYRFQGFIYNPAVNGDEANISMDGITSGVYMNPLYDSESTKEDACIREVAYLDKDKPSIKSSNIKLSVVNYTGVLSSLFGVPQYIELSNTTQDYSNTALIDGLEDVPRQIVSSLQKKGLNTAAGIGIAANVYAECSFNIGQCIIDSNGKRSYGMCMWNGDNGSAMVRYVGSDWRTNLTGQINFLWYDMTKRQPNWFKSMMKRKMNLNMTIVQGLKSVSNNEAGARRAADIFVRCYENPLNPDKQSVKRQNYASDLWKKVIPVLK